MEKHFDETKVDNQVFESFCNKLITKPNANDIESEMTRKAAWCYYFLMVTFLKIHDSFLAIEVSSDW